MSRDLSAAEKKLLLEKVPKALGQGRKSFETKTETNAVLVKAGYKKYFDIDPPIVHTDKKTKHKHDGAGTSVGAGINSRATIVAKAASKSKKDVKKLCIPSVSKVLYTRSDHIFLCISCFIGITGVTNNALHVLHVLQVSQVSPLSKIQAGKMLIELDSDLKPDIAKIMEEIIDSNDHLSTVSRQYNIANITLPI